MRDEIEPLEPALWLERFAELMTREKDGDEFVSCLRHAFHLVQLAPQPLRHLIWSHLTENEFEELLNAGAMQDAAIALIGDPMTYQISKLPDHRLCAEVKFPDDQEGSLAVAGSEALAIFNAWLQRLASLDRSSMAALDAPNQSFQHRGRNGRRQQSTERQGET